MNKKIIISTLLIFVPVAISYSRTNIALMDLSSFSKAVDAASPSEDLSLAADVFESNLSDADKRTKLEIIANKKTNNNSAKSIVLNEIDDYQKIIEDSIAMTRNIKSPAKTALQILSPSNPERFKKYLVYLLQFSNASNAQKQEVIRYLSTMTSNLPANFNRAKFGPLAELFLSFVNAPTSSSFLNHIIKSDVPSKAFYVRYFLEGGANPDQADSKEVTPSSIASSPEIRQAILNAQATR